MTAWLLLACAIQDQALPPVKSVTLERAERTVAEALAAIRDQTGVEIEASSTVGERRIDVGWADTPVLKALDDLCREAGAGRVRVAHARGDVGEDSLDVNWNAERPLGTAHWNQFSAEITDVTIVTTRSLRKVERNATLAVHLDAQPGVRPMRVGSFVLDEVVDDAGWTLTTGAVDDRSWRGEVVAEGEDSDFVSIGRDRSGREGWEARPVQIRAPAPEATRLTVLRGHVLVSFPVRRVEEEIPFGEVVPGREIVIGAMKVTIVSVELGEQKLTIACKVRHPGDRGTFPWFEVVDEDGNSAADASDGNGDGETYTMTYDRSGPVPVAAIRYSAIVGRTTIRVPFEFHDVPLKREDW